MILTETPRRQRVTKLVSWGHWFAFFNILTGIVIASIYIFNSPVPNTGLGVAYLLTNWISHIGFLTFIGFIVFILPLCYLIPNPSLMKGLSSTIAASGLALLAFDALLYTKQGLHLSMGSASLIHNETRQVMQELSGLQWGYLGLMFVVWLSFQLLMANALWKRIERFQKMKVGIPVSSFFIACFIASHASHIWADANLYHPILAQDDMFPLSYPTTAKKLMSKHGLLNIENYEQRKLLQLDRQIDKIHYPLSPLYCTVSPSKPLLILLQSDHGPFSLNHPELNYYSDYYDLSSNNDKGQFSVLYGLPELYFSGLMDYKPILLDLPHKVKLPVAVYGATRGIQPYIDNELINDWPQFISHIASTQPKLLIGFVTSSELSQVLNMGITEHYQLLISQLQADSKVGLYTNIKSQQPISGNHLDLATSALKLLGCEAKSNTYSTGQNLFSPTRNWMISTVKDKIVLQTVQQRIEVDSSGHYKILLLESGQESDQPLNVPLLSQGIKHLSRFNDNR